MEHPDDTRRTRVPLWVTGLFMGGVLRVLD